MSDLMVSHEKTIVDATGPTLLGQAVDMQGNLARLLERHSPYLILLLVAVGLDAISTIAFMSVLGTGAEQNPLVRHLSDALGVIIGPPVGKLFQLFAVTVLAIITPRLARFIFTTVILMNLFAFVINMHAFMLHR